MKTYFITLVFLNLKTADEFIAIKGERDIVAQTYVQSKHLIGYDGPSAIIIHVATTKEIMRLR